MRKDTGALLVFAALDAIRAASLFLRMRTPDLGAWPTHFAPLLTSPGLRSSCLGLARGTVRKYVNRARRAGLTLPLPPELDDDVRLENRLSPPPSDRPSDERPHPDWTLVHRELISPPLFR
jgi:hypothetical protein